MKKLKTMSFNNDFLYLMIRFLCLMCGLFLLSCAALAVFAPAIMFSDSEKIPPQTETLLHSTPFFLIGLFILIPDRFFLTKKLYTLRLSLFSLIEMFVLYRGIRDIYLNTNENISSTILSMSVSFIVMGAFLPLSIYLKKKITAPQQVLGKLV